MKTLKIMALAAAFILPFTGASAEVISWNPHINVEYKFYNVSGNSVAAIRKSISRKSTAKLGKKRRPSRSNVTSHMKYQWRITPGRCVMRKGNTYNKVVQTLPKLTGSPSAAVRKKFDAYVNALKKYERAGIEFRVKAAVAVQKYYHSKPSFPCQKFKAGIGANTDAIYKKWDKQMYKYWYSKKPPTFK